MSDSVLEFRGVSFGYRRTTVLEGFDLTVGGGLTFLVGENGAGKTTTFRLALGALRPRRGSIVRHGSGAPAGRLRQKSDLIGYLPQSFTAPPHMSLHRYLEYIGWLRLMSKHDLVSAVPRALARVGLGDRAADRVATLSGGMFRRLGVAQAILHEPSLVLLDEPTVGLDPQGRVDLRRLMRDLAEDTAVLCSTHLLEDAGATNGTLVALKDGRVVFQGHATEFQTLAATGKPGSTDEGLTPLEAAFLQLMGKS
ncbi:ABC transporter ATP-binding protein [Luteimicrobium album]|uniref:ABC transporter ATP-binding protein n=1 Tax=Luteimicrobium album TaxID=1054550 RepID=A0ABQ6I0C1_9MICO|nr:ATP-binding cassette domain-containing protein [Luteimicrobium album]GMA23414.1 ABC transporter ATP-binding protein [Luteimicrobium album]